MSEPFDREGLMQNLDDDLEFLAETVAMLDEDAPGLLQQAAEAAGTGDAEALAAAAHTLKGMFANFCADPARDAAFAVERMAREHQLDGIGPAVDVLRSEAERLTSALHAMLKAETP
jgi:two-component system sensor histidine kinase/response regulator